MAHGHSRDQWIRLSVLLATMVNINRDPKQEPIKPGQLDIYDTAGRLKKAPKKRKTTLADIMRSCGVKRQQKGATNGHGTQSDENHRPQPMDGRGARDARVDDDPGQLRGV